MRRRVSSNGLTVQGVAGTHAVFFGFDLDPGARKNCLGFSLHRTDHTEMEQYWVYGFKTFRSVVPVPTEGGRYRTREHPVQSFYWGDYTAKPGHLYTYRIVPRYGSPKSLQDRKGVEASVEISTHDPAEGRHGIHFNRGVAASQAYSAKYGLPPEKLPSDVRAKAMQWLSRGLMEALIAFIDQASSNKFALRAAVYEFTDPQVLAAFRRASESGVDVKVVFHSRGEQQAVNELAIYQASLPPKMMIPRTGAKIAHNKFIVLCEKSHNGLSPTAVWTGSTNLTPGGIFGHSNVGHEVRDTEVANQFLRYWEKLAEDPDTPTLRKWVDTHNEAQPDRLKTKGVHVLFSPRRGLTLLDWYAKQFGQVSTVGTITAAFGLGPLFEEGILTHQGQGIHFVALEKADKEQETWTGSTRVLVAVGATGGPDALARWGKEGLSNFNSWVRFLHTKILLIDPLSANPTVITGSANFSPASTNTNDENMIVVCGDTEVADTYFTEFARIFNHFYARWWASQIRRGPYGADDRSFLIENHDWQKPYFKRGNPKQLQRTLFATGVEGNS